MKFGKMRKLYLVKDGIEGVGYPSANNKRLLNTNFHLITYDFNSNEGYIDKKGENNWRLYTQVGQKLHESRYHNLNSFRQCVNKLKELKGGDQIVICKSEEVDRIKTTANKC